MNYNIIVIGRSYQAFLTSTTCYSQHQHNLQHSCHHHLQRCYYKATIKRQHHQQPSQHQCHVLQRCHHIHTATDMSKFPTLASPWGYLEWQPWPPPWLGKWRHHASSKHFNNNNTQGRYNINPNRDTTRALHMANSSKWTCCLAKGEKCHSPI
jgi:hypothetical protein